MAQYPLIDELGNIVLHRAFGFAIPVAREVSGEALDISEWDIDLVVFDPNDPDDFLLEVELTADPENETGKLLTLTRAHAALLPDRPTRYAIRRSQPGKDPEKLGGGTICARGHDAT